MITLCYIFYFFLLTFSFMAFFLGLYFHISDYVVILEYEFFSLNSSSIVMSFLLDWMSLFFMSFVFFISSVVIMYSEDYMEGDLNINRFIYLVVLFVGSMFFLIVSPNLISILLGWDGLGLVSYCLVIYYQNVKSYNAGMLTALSNRLGDVSLLMAIAWMLNYGSWNYIFYLDWSKSDLEMKIISLLVIFAAFTKSAQIPFSSWLPAAMAAPTPVSSLVHSSTLVTAGVYLLIRFSPCFDLNMSVFLFISLMTMFMSGLGANYEFDLKKIIALSTLSQLGLMMSILFLGDSFMAFFHLLIHALFKALLFMCAGNIIHNMGNCQDIRYMGSLVISMPLTCTIMNISNLSLCGMPFLSGFYSKDLILEFLSMTNFNFFLYFLFFLSTGLTVSYTFRLIYYSMYGCLNFTSLNGLGDSSNHILASMVKLLILVIVGGSLMSWLMFSFPYYICLPKYLKFMTLMVIIMGAWLGTEIAKFKLNFSLKARDSVSISLFFSGMLNMPFMSTFGINFFPLNWGLSYNKMMDNGWSEYVGGQHFYYNMTLNSRMFRILFSNNLKIYLMLFIIFIMFMFICF
uniref:NADH-ubiquinone oxidoreductase chain 5 n=1 Tax=Drilonius striatulus TaxID=341977 RepID=A0A0S2MRI1_9COLE|nr:NADH deshydrogenase subunit 5 [Drilonius striatulus]